MDSLYVRYANALLSIAKDENKISSYKDTFNDFCELLHDNDELFTYLKSYFASEEEKYKIIDEITNSYNLNNFSSFIKLLVKKHRINDIKGIHNEFNKAANYELGIYDGYVYSTKPLNNEQISKIEQSVGEKLSHKVELKNKIDESLIGGIKVAVNDHVFDGSIKNKIETLKNKLSERSINNEN